MTPGALGILEVLHAQWRLPTASNCRASAGTHDRPWCRGDTFSCNTIPVPRPQPIDGPGILTNKMVIVPLPRRKTGNVLLRAGLL